MPRARSHCGCIVRVRMVRVRFVVMVNPCIRPFFLITEIIFSRSQKDTIPPAPPQQLAQLLEDHKVQYSTGCNLAVVIARDTVPVEPVQGLG